MGQVSDIEGDEARGETFFIALMTADSEDGTQRLSQLAGRFVDRFERTDGEWRIKNRVAVHDLSITLRIDEDYLASNELKRGTRDIDDPGAALLAMAYRSGRSASG
ncbi:MAG: nuclear transport factor 2 family protein [Novosphingobium sp.]|nr:nuclear transport factor 2 family protein [Novosphingobium sp.]